jgi:flagellar motor component MotA
MMTMNMEDPHQVEDAMEKQQEKHHHEAQEPRTRCRTWPTPCRRSGSWPPCWG